MRADVKSETKATETLHHLVTRTSLGTIRTLFTSTPKSTLMLMSIAIEIQMSAHRHTRLILPWHNTWGSIFFFKLFDIFSTHDQRVITSAMSITWRPLLSVWCKLFEKSLKLLG